MSVGFTLKKIKLNFWKNIRDGKFCKRSTKNTIKIVILKFEFENRKIYKKSNFLQKFHFFQKFQFFTKNPNFDKNFIFFTKNSNFLQKIQIFTKIPIFLQNLGDFRISTEFTNFCFSEFSNLYRIYLPNLLLFSLILFDFIFRFC